MAFAIHDRVERRRLEVRPKPYFVRLADGLHLGYRKGKLVSRWVVRDVVDGRYRLRTVPGVEPDDRRVSDGIRFLDYQQMVERLMNDVSEENRNQERVACSFCGKDHTQVAKLIAGPGVFICDGCVALCQVYIEYPEHEGRLLVEDGRPVMRGGIPVFVPLSDEELAMREALKRDA